MRDAQAFDDWFSNQTDYCECSSCGNLTRETVQPDWPVGKSFCLPCFRLAEARGISVFNLNVRNTQ